MQNHIEMIAPARMDAAGAEKLAHQFDDAVRNGHYDVRLSLRLTGFLSSAGIRIMLTYHRQLVRLGGSLAIHDVNDMTRATLELSGLAELLAASNAASIPVPASSAAAPADAIMSATADLSAEIIDAHNCLSSWRVGRPEFSNRPQADPPDLISLTPADNCYAVGLGAFGAPADCRTHAGELICAAGMAVYRSPCDKIPDYLLKITSTPPELHALYLAGYTGQFATLSRFRAGANGDFTLTELLRRIMAGHSWPAMGFAMMAETSGLTGATMIHAPGNGNNAAFFEFPGIRDRLEFTPEPEYAGDLAVIIGVVFHDTAPPAEWRPFVRPWNEADSVFGHAHAAVLTYRALPAGRPGFAELFRELLEQSKLRAVLHLINDNRPATGAGESRFRNGLLWGGPLTG